MKVADSSDEIRDTGSCNAGYHNTGDYNIGEWNAGDYNVGFFNAESPVFNC